MKDPRTRMDFGLSRLIRYNGKRQTFFQKLHRLTSFINALMASSAFVTILSQWWQLAAWLTAGVAILSAADSVIGFAERAKLFGDLRRRYYDLYCELLLTRPDQYNEDEFREKRLRIDRDGPPTMRVLDVISRNEEDIARGFKREETDLHQLAKKDCLPVHGSGAQALGNLEGERKAAAWPSLSPAPPGEVHRAWRDRGRIYPVTMRELEGRQINNL